MTFDQLSNGQRVELALVHLDIAKHSSLPGTDRALQAAKIMLRQQAEGIASIRGGKLFTWAGDGGAFMFLTGDGNAFDDLAFTAIQILGTLPAINEEIRLRTDLEAALSLRVCCDCGPATYHTDPGNITADFINRFMKNERAIGLTNTISVTDRAWKQFSAKVGTMFRPFKHSEEVNALIYNRGGREAQAAVLASLNNRTNSDSEHEGEFVEVIAFKGDTLLELSREAYADVLGKGEESIDKRFANVGGLNLMVTKNAELCRNHDERRFDDDVRRMDAPFTLREVLHSRSGVDPRQIRELERLWPHLPPEMRHEVERALRNADTTCQVESVLHQVLDELHYLDRRMYRGTDPLAPMQGGESLRFYNSAALGFFPVIGESTLLDHVVAGNLTIARVIGGVEHTVASVRTFVKKHGEYVEVDPRENDDDTSVDSKRE